MSLGRSGILEGQGSWKVRDLGRSGILEGQGFGSHLEGQGSWKVRDLGRSGILKVRDWDNSPWADVKDWGEGQEGMELETNGTVFLFKKDNLQFADFIHSDLQSKQTNEQTKTNGGWQSLWQCHSSNNKAGPL